jgi:beta-galactosidase
VSQGVATARAPARIELLGDPVTLRADGVSVAVVTARIVDGEGNVVPTANQTITFSVQGDAGIRGIGGVPESTAAAGLARIVVQAGLAASDIVVTATGPELEPGSLWLRSAP